MLSRMARSQEGGQRREPAAKPHGGQGSGEGGIRTLDPPFGRYAISSRVPSATRTPLRAAEGRAAADCPQEGRLRIAVSGRSGRRSALAGGAARRCHRRGPLVAALIRPSATEPCPASDAEPPLHCPVLLSILRRTPDKQHA